MSKHVRPSIIAQRHINIRTGQPQPTRQRYSAIDVSLVRRPVGIGSSHVHAQAVAEANARVRTTVQVIDGLVIEADAIFEPRPHSEEFILKQIAGSFASLLKGEF